MLSVKYHVTSIIAVFVALGIGMLIGGTAGQGVVSGAQRQLERTLEAQYEQLAADHDALQTKLSTAEAITRELTPELNGTRIEWDGGTDERSLTLINTLRALGAVISVADGKGERLSRPALVQPELLLIAGSSERSELYAASAEDAEATAAEQRVKAAVPELRFSVAQYDARSPKAIARFIQRIREKLKEGEAAHAAIGVRDRSGME